MTQRQPLTSHRTAEIIRFPRGDQMDPSNRVKATDRKYLGIELFRGGTFLGTALSSRDGLLAYDAEGNHAGCFSDFDSAIEAIFAAALG
jgi:hypothetical protein